MLIHYIYISGRSEEQRQLLNYQLSAGGIIALNARARAREEDTREEIEINEVISEVTRYVIIPWHVIVSLSREGVDLTSVKKLFLPESLSDEEGVVCFFDRLSNYRMSYICEASSHPRSTARQIGEDHGDQIRGVEFSPFGEGFEPTKGSPDDP